MRKKRILVGILSIMLLVCSLQLPAVFAVGSLPMGDGKIINPDVNVDDAINNDDLSALREVLVGKSATESFDVNSDEACDVKDLVVLKKFVETNYGKDNDYVIN